MSRLEEKLIELGYERNPNLTNHYTKESRAVSNVVIFIEINNNGIADRGIVPISNIRREREIDLLYAVLKEMQKDLEVLKEYE